MQASRDTRTTRLRRGATTAVAAAALVLPMGVPAAQAELRRAGPTDPETQVPRWYEDSNGLRLQLCDDAARCEVEPGESVYWAAEASITSFGGRALLVLGLAAEQENATAPVVVGGELVIRARGLRPSSRYKVTHPYGVQRLLSSARGRLRYVDEAGCEVEQEPGGPPPPPCDFSAALQAPVGPFLTWDPRSAPRAPAGYIGDGGPLEATNRVVGSPRNTNVFRIEGPGMGRRGVATGQFLVMGKVAGASRPDLVPRSDGPPDTDDNYTADATPTVRGLAEPRTSVELLADGETVATTTAANGRYRLTLPPLTDGVHAVRAAAVDGEVPGPSMALRLRIDTLEPVVRRVRATPRRLVVGPRRSTKLTMHVSEAARVRMRVLRGDRVVKSQRPRATGQAREVSWRWGGRNNRGVLVHAGRYRLRAVAVDRAGHRTVQRGRAVRVVG